MFGCGGSPRNSIARKQAALEATPFFSALAGSSPGLLKQLSRAAVLRKAPAGSTLSDVVHGTFIVVVEGELVHTEMRSNSRFLRRGSSQVAAARVEAEVMATRKAGDFFRLADAPGGSKANKLAELSQVTASQKTLLLLLTPSALNMALAAMKDEKADAAGAGHAHRILQEMVRQDISELVAKVPCFEPIDRGARRILSQLFSYEVVPPGANLFAEGERGEGFVILLHGELEVHQGGRKVATRVPTAFLGEIALLYNCERTATIQCSDQVRSAHEHDPPLRVDGPLPYLLPLSTNPQLNTHGAHATARRHCFRAGGVGTLTACRALPAHARQGAR